MSQKRILLQLCNAAHEKSPIDRRCMHVREFVAYQSLFVAVSRKTCNSCLEPVRTNRCDIRNNSAILTQAQLALICQVAGI